MLKSIQWTLQIWHAALLAAVLIGFGTATYYGVSQSQYAEVDAKLERYVQALAAGVHPAPPPQRGPNDGFGGPGPHGPGGGGGMGGQGMGGPGGQQGDRWGGGAGGGGPGGGGPGMGGPGGQQGDRWGGGGPGGGGPGGGGPGRGWDSGLEVDVPAGLDLAAREATPEAYFVVWGGNGQVLKSSPFAKGIAMPEPPPLIMGQSRTIWPELRDRGNNREAIVYGQFGLRALVGQSIVAEEAGLQQLRYKLVATGLGVLLIGLIGGWIVSWRAIRPIRAIATAAQNISATNLSRRIDVAGTQSELGSLAGVLNKMFERLEASFAQQVRFTADASHELRTPLAVIHTHAQLALSRQRTPEEYQKALATCLRASGRMKGLVESLLLLASADAGRLTLEQQAVDLADVVRDSVAMVGPLAVEKNVTVMMELAAVEVMGDGMRLSQVAINFLSNAIRYNKDGGSVTVSVKAEGNEAVMMVTDTGVGIPPEHLAHLCERFYRVDVARSRDVGGSGLGLAICKSIVDGHGGRIGFASEEGKGTTVTLRMPRGGETEMATALREAMPGAEQG